MIQFKCMQLSKVKREKNRGLIWSRNTCLDSLLAAAQSLLLEGLENF
jgi:hypothetical protein